VWSFTKGSNLYPNCYIVLTGPPGVGKSVVLTKAETLLRKIEKLHVAPSSVTTASLIDTLAASDVSFTEIYPVKLDIKFNSLFVLSSELGIFMTAYETQFINTLNKLYDGELYEERRRTGKKEHTRIDAPSLAIIAGTTPAFINTTLPDCAWDQGFTSRTIFVFHGEETKGTVFGKATDSVHQERIRDMLVQDAREARKMYGEMEWDLDAQTMIEVWNENGRKPIPEHNKLTHYNSRRLAHILKLSMIASIAESNEGRIRAGHVELAFKWLFEVEDNMPDIFATAGVVGDARAMEDLHYFVMMTAKHSENKMVGEHLLYKFLQKKVPSYSIPKVIEVMVASHDLIKHYDGGRTWYTAGVKLKH